MQKWRKSEALINCTAVVFHFIQPERIGAVSVRGSSVLGYGNRAFTLAVVIKPNEAVSIGTAICNHQDQYSRKVGRQIAEGRALMMMAAYCGLIDTPTHIGPVVFADVASVDTLDSLIDPVIARFGARLQEAKSRDRFNNIIAMVRSKAVTYG